MDDTGPTSDGRTEADAVGLVARLRSMPRWVHLLGTLVGVGLLVAAIMMIVARFDEVRDSLSHVLDAPWWMFALLVLGVIGNILGTGLMFWVLYRRFGRVEFFEMQAVMCSATLLNYLPLRPGLLGRIAYHKSANDIRVRDSVRTMVDATVLSIIVALYDAIGVGLLRVLEMDSTLALAGWLAALPVAAMMVALGARRHRVVRLWAAAFLVRAIELLIWTGRYVLAFEMMGISIGLDAALVFACVSSFASMVPFVSNGLGLREWGIGVLAPAMVSEVMVIGFTGELVNRAIEILTVAILGVPATIHVAQRWIRPDQPSD